MADTDVRQHTSQHEAIKDLPLVTDSARVIEIENQDRNRKQEVIDSVSEWLEKEGLADSYGPVSASTDLFELHQQLAAGDHRKIARRVQTLAERYNRPYPMLTRIRFETDDPFEFLAGQYVGMEYNKVPRAYSLSNSPTEDEIEICVRRVPDGKLSPQLCETTEIGDEVTIRGPYGDLVFGDHSSRDLVFLATGTGVAPFRSMIDYLFETGRDVHNGTKRDVWLFLGASWEDDLPYKEHFRDLADARDNFEFVPCLSREKILSDWEGETDYVQHAFLKHADPSVITTGVDEETERWIEQDPASGTAKRIDPFELNVYACGINAMVFSLVETVERLGVPASRIESEGFG